MIDFLKGIQDAFIARINSMLFINFIIAWLFVNYDISLTILFKEMPIDDKIYYIDKLSFDWWLWLVLPLIIALIYIFVMPFINLWISIIYNKFLEQDIKKHENEKLEEHYDRKKLLEEKRLEATIFVEKNLEAEKIKKVNKAEEAKLTLDKEVNKVRLEAVKLEERENAAKEEKIKLEERENKTKEEKLKLKLKENNINKKTEIASSEKLEELRKNLQEKEQEWFKQQEAIAEAEEQYRSQQEVIAKAEGQYRSQQEAIAEAEEQYRGQQEAIKQVEKSYMHQREALVLAEAQLKSQEEAIAKADEKLQNINNLTKAEKEIIKNIAQNGGTQKGPALLESMSYDQVKTIYILDGMEGVYINRGTYSFDSSLNVTKLLTKGQKVAIDEGYVK